jgi:putative endonuclease
MDPCVYILASRIHGTLYIGVTSDLHGRMQEHVQGLFSGFSKMHGVTMLVYYEAHADMVSAIKREKQLKKWNRAWKLRLIESMNPAWENLYDPKTDEVKSGPADLRRTSGGRPSDIDLGGFPPSRE